MANLPDPEFELTVMVWEDFDGNVKLECSVEETWKSWCKRNEPEEYEEESELEYAERYPDDIPF